MATETVDKSVPLRDRLRTALSAAMKARNRNAISALRATLAAIDNAEAVDATEVRAGAIETSAAGLGAAEVARRHLTEADIEQIVRSEVTDRHTAAEEYDRLGRTDHGDKLREEAAALTSLL